MDTYVRARIDSDLKHRATLALNAMGLSLSDAIRLMLISVANEQQLPFTPKVPNTVTQAAIAELEAGHGTRATDFDELMRQMDKPKC